MTLNTKLRILCLSAKALFNKLKKTYNALF